jgi:hypothetical protein
VPSGALVGIPLPPGPMLVLPVAEPMLVRPPAPRLARPAILFDRRRWSADGDGFMACVFYSVGVIWVGAQALSSSDRDHLAFLVLTMVTSTKRGIAARSRVRRLAGRLLGVHNDHAVDA